jgi:hypothetical protein
MFLSIPVAINSTAVKQLTLKLSSTNLTADVDLDGYLYCCLCSSSEGQLLLNLDRDLN